MPDDTLIAGYSKLVLWVSSTSQDMAIQAAVRVLDENNNEVPYEVGRNRRRPDRESGIKPIGKGGLKVSHRKLDPDKSTIYRPYQTNLKEDHQPLSPGEVVKVEIEIWPGVAYIKKGHRLRLDIQPESGCFIGDRIVDAFDQTYQKDSFNTIYTGPEHKSYLQLPVIPPDK